MITTTRINVTISKAVLEKLDVYCREMGVSRSAALSTLSMQALKGYEGLQALADAVTLSKDEALKGKGEGQR